LDQRNLSDAEASWITRLVTALCATIVGWRSIVGRHAATVNARDDVLAESDRLVIRQGEIGPADVVAAGAVADVTWAAVLGEEGVNVLLEADDAVRRAFGARVEAGVGAAGIERTGVFGARIGSRDRCASGGAAGPASAPTARSASAAHAAARAGTRPSVGRAARAAATRACAGRSVGDDVRAVVVRASGEACKERGKRKKNEAAHRCLASPGE
jgi:hypothetical protein